MVGGYRVLIAGAVAALMLTMLGLGWVSGYALNSPGDERHQPYRYASDKPLEIDPAAPRRANAQSFEYRAPCDNPKGRDESDLCAQWKAANAAEDSALWTKYGFWIGVIGSTLLLWQIILTREAVEDTAAATKAMGEANKIAENAQRAWVRLSARPKYARSSGINGLYLRIDFVAENTGQTAATHYALEHRVFFKRYGESGDAVAEEMRAQVDAWLKHHDAEAFSILAPNDTEISGNWQSYTEDEVKWAYRDFEGEVAQPMLLAATFYRTAFQPEVLQVSWRSWYLVTVRDDGQLKTHLPKPKPNERFGPDALRVDPYHRAVVHHEHRTEK